MIGHFERIDTQTVCDEKTMCDTGKCQNETQILCDGKFDCPDKKTNKLQRTPNQAPDWLEERLPSMKEEIESRLSLLGICDDGFGIVDANVVCKEAGFRSVQKRLYCQIWISALLDDLIVKEVKTPCLNANLILGT